MATQTIKEYPKDGLRTHLEPVVKGYYLSSPPIGFIPSEEFGRVAEDFTIERMVDSDSVDLEKQVHEAMLAMGFVPKEPNIHGGFLRYKRSPEEGISTIFINCSQSTNAAWGRVTVYDLEKK